MNMQITDFYGSETIVYDTVRVESYPYNFVKTHIMYNSKKELGFILT